MKTKPISLPVASTVASIPTSAPPAGGRMRPNPALIAIAVVLAGVAAFAPVQLPRTVAFAGSALAQIAPWLLLSVALSAYARASGADKLIALAFTGRPLRAIALASLFGALSPFCSCGVVPVVAGLLGAGVPLAPVMSFWVSSPLMDPTMFLMTSGSLGMEFALAKTVAALAIGLAAGALTHALTARGLLRGALRASQTDGDASTSGGAEGITGSGDDPVRMPRPQWRVWESPLQRVEFLATARANLWLLLRWMTLAFLLESLMAAYVPASAITDLLSEGAAAIPAAVALGVPAYFNGYAALPLVRGLIDLGMSPAVGMAFLVAGGMTSIPAATAVWALVRARVFALYVGLAVAGSLAAAYGYALWLAFPAT